MTITLTTTGRRSRKPRPVTLYGFEDADRVVVVGSWGGAATDPAWVRNLRAHPLATLRRGREEREVAAHEAGGAERDRLWARRGGGGGIGLDWKDR